MQAADLSDGACILFSALPFVFTLRPAADPQGPKVPRLFDASLRLSSDVWFDLANERDEVGFTWL